MYSFTPFVAVVRVKGRSHRGDAEDAEFCLGFLRTLGVSAVHLRLAKQSATR